MMNLLQTTPVIVDDSRGSWMKSVFELVELVYNVWNFHVGTTYEICLPSTYNHCSKLNGPRLESWWQSAWCTLSGLLAGEIRNCLSLVGPFSTAIYSISFKPKIKSFRNHPKSSFLGSFYDLDTTISRFSKFEWNLLFVIGFWKVSGCRGFHEKFETLGDGAKV